MIANRLPLLPRRRLCRGFAVAVFFSLIMYTAFHTTKVFTEESRYSVSWPYDDTIDIYDHITYEFDTEATRSEPEPDDFPFKYILNEPNLCTDDVKIINFIFVAVDEQGKRSQMRSMWADKKYLNKTGMRSAFVVAKSHSDSNQAALVHESETFQDIIQLDFFDSYENLTLKTLSIFHWTRTFCPNSVWVLKSDTDVFVNSFSIARYLESAKNDFVCQVCMRCLVCRDEMSCPLKWKVKKEDYSESHYPPYCLGSAYAVRTQTAKALYTIANKSHPLVIEDAYFTGILPQRLNATYGNINQTFFLRHPLRYQKNRSLPNRFVEGTPFMILNIERLTANAYQQWMKIVKQNILEK